MCSHFVAFSGLDGRRRLLLYRLLSLMVVLGMVASSLNWNVAGTTASSVLRGSPALDALVWPEEGGDTGNFLYRTRVRIANPYDRARLDKLGVAVLSEGAGVDRTPWALVLAERRHR